MSGQNLSAAGGSWENLPLSASAAYNKRWWARGLVLFVLRCFSFSCSIIVFIVKLKTQLYSLLRFQVPVSVCHGGDDRSDYYEDRGEKPQKVIDCKCWEGKKPCKSTGFNYLNTRDMWHTKGYTRYEEGQTNELREDVALNTDTVGCTLVHILKGLGWNGAIK